MKLITFFSYKLIMRKYKNFSLSKFILKLKKSIKKFFQLFDKIKINDGKNILFKLKLIYYHFIF